MFDLGVRQIAQETIPEHSRGIVNGQWKSMTAFFEMASYLIALTIQGIFHPGFIDLIQLYLIL
jgi:hypothetical protein